jgi:predicted nucleotide-binding protein (sugar kinase/HSP70/actin superfamily)
MKNIRKIDIMKTIRSIRIRSISKNNKDDNKKYLYNNLAKKSIKKNFEKESEIKTEKNYEGKKFAFYQIGNSSIATNAFARKLGIETLQLAHPNPQTISKGVLYAPEFSCFPFKIFLGMIIQSIEKGAEVFVIPSPTSIIACQSADFGMAQKYILQRTGKSFQIILLDNLNPADITKKFAKYTSKATIRNVSEGMIIAGQKIFLIEETEQYYMKIYTSAGKERAERFLSKWLSEIDKTDSIIDLYNVGPRLRKDYRKHPKLNLKKYLKIAVIGDIYTINERFINNSIFERLSSQKIYTEKGISISAFTKIYSKSNPEDILSINQAKKYLKHNVGAFSMHTIKSAIKYAEERYDGLIHIYPFSCMPEITVRSILPKISSDYGIPILYLPIDEQTGDAGFTTRIEAFIDLLKIRKEKKLKDISYNESLKKK